MIETIDGVADVYCLSWTAPHRERDSTLTFDHLVLRSA